MAAKKVAKRTSSRKVVEKKATADKSVVGRSRVARKVAPKVAAAQEGRGARTATVKRASATGAGTTGAQSALNVGDLAPSFDLKDQNGVMVSSAALKGTAYVVYFYPKDNTPGCTQEACDFRDRHGAFIGKKVKVFGVSGDSEKSHAGFASKYSLPFSILVDEGNALASRYGAYGLKKLYGREFHGIIRSTFVVGKDGRILAVHRGVKVPGHVEKILEQLS